MQLVKLEWDSDFFGLNIGKASVDYKFDFQLFESKKKTSFDLIYLFTKFPIKQLKAIDIRIELERNIDLNEDFIANDDITVWCGNTTKELFELAIASGHQSRFKKDYQLAPKFDQLYKLWIEKSVERKLADYVLVAQKNNKIVGMLTLKINEKFSEIGLIAVSSKGEGLGNKLMQKAFQVTKNNNKNLIKVVTQKENEEAMHFYKKNGFIISKTNYVYHYWTK